MVDERRLGRFAAPASTVTGLSRYFAPLAVALLLTGCAGAKFSVPQDPLVLLGDGAALYAAVPVVPNRTLLDGAFVSIAGLTEKDRESWNSLVDRTQTARVALFEDRALTIVLTGSFPKAAEAIVFPGSKGWSRVRGEEGAAWYENGPIAASIPSAGIVCVAVSRASEPLAHTSLSAVGLAMQGMLSRATPDSSLPRVSEAFEAGSASLSYGSDIALYLAAPKAVLPSLFGEDFTLPIETGECFARPAKDGTSYVLSISLVAPDERRSRAIATIVRIMSGAEPITNGASVFFSVNDVSVETLAGFADFLLF